MDDFTVKAEDLPTPEEALTQDESRYSKTPAITDSASGLTTLRLYRRDRTVYESVTGLKYYQITPATTNRPDLISQAVYGNPVYWWIISEANNIGGIEGLTTGRTLKIPDLETVLINIATEGESVIFA